MDTKSARHQAILQAYNSAYKSKTHFFDYNPSNLGELPYNFVVDFVCTRWLYHSLLCWGGFSVNEIYKMSNQEVRALLLDKELERLKLSKNDLNIRKELSLIDSKTKKFYEPYQLIDQFIANWGHKIESGLETESMREYRQHYTKNLSKLKPKQNPKSVMKPPPKSKAKKPDPKPDIILTKKQFFEREWRGRGRNANKWTVNDLKKSLQYHKLSTQGSKTALGYRLEMYFKTGGAKLPL